MRLSEILNPMVAKENELGCFEDLVSSECTNAKSAHSRDLEIIYRTIKDGSPNTDILKHILNRYTSVTSVVYLRSWFNNRHNKYKRLVNLRRLRLVETLKSYSDSDKTILLENNTLYLDQIYPNTFELACQVLNEIQKTAAQYLATSNELLN
eukprot:NODE_584_length_6418_cov_0.079601.p4 type:complete len:152 gc:universal NODE_584_length_6418_cov_0.079601:2262-2717(+)